MIYAIVSGVFFVLTFAGINFVAKARSEASNPMKEDKPLSVIVKTDPGASAPPAGRPVPITIPNNDGRSTPPANGDKKK